MAKSKRIATCGLCATERHIRSRGLCGACYERASSAGILEQFKRVRHSFDETLAKAKTGRSVDECWLWPSVLPTGYTTPVKLDGVGVGAHVVTWVRANGPAPDGLELDHICHTNDPSCKGGFSCLHRRCVNPAHLEPVTHAENQRRSHRYRADTCAHGHPREGNSVWKDGRIRKDGTRARYRQCVACRVEYSRRKAEENRVVREPRTHCAHGHPWTEENVRVGPKGDRTCRVCHRISERVRYQAKRHGAPHKS